MVGATPAQRNQTFKGFLVVKPTVRLACQTHHDVVNSFPYPAPPPSSSGCKTSCLPPPTWASPTRRVSSSHRNARLARPPKRTRCARITLRHPCCRKPPHSEGCAGRWQVGHFTVRSAPGKGCKAQAGVLHGAGSTAIACMESIEGTVFRGGDGKLESWKGKPRPLHRGLQA